MHTCEQNAYFFGALEIYQSISCVYDMAQFGNNKSHRKTETILVQVKLYGLRVHNVTS